MAIDIFPSSIDPTSSVGEPTVTIGLNILPDSIASDSVVGVPGIFVTNKAVNVIESPIGRTYVLDQEDRTFIVQVGNTKMKFIDKDPNAQLNYSFDLSEWLETDDEISSFTLTKSDNINLVSQDATTSIITAVISGGAAQGEESLTCNFNTLNGYSDDRTIVFEMGNR